MLKFKHFINSDDSSWITFIHGAGGSSTIWHKQVKVLKEHFNLLLIDLRGHGMSNDMPVDNHYSLDLVVDEVVEVIQHLNIKKSHFIGVSLGTIIITKISNLYPKIVDKVVLSGAITSFSTRTLFLLRTAQAIKGFTPNIILYRLFALIIMPSKFVQQIEEYVKDKSNCFLKKVNNSGHIVNIDQHKIFNNFTLKFLK